MRSSFDISIVIPAKDEEKRLPKFLDVLMAYAKGTTKKYEFIVVDDGSRDSTYEVAIAKQKIFPDLKVIRLKTNQGKGYAVKCGLFAASGDICVFMDADGSTRPDEIEKNIHYFDSGYDIVIGSRVLESPVHTIKAKIYRKSIGSIFNFLVHTFLMKGIQDTQCGFKMFKKEVIRPLFEGITIKGFGFDMELLYLASRLSYKIKEVPINWHHKKGSKVNLILDPLKMIINILQIRDRHRDLASPQNTS